MKERRRRLSPAEKIVALLEELNHRSKRIMATLKNVQDEIVSINDSITELIARLGDHDHGGASAAEFEALVVSLKAVQVALDAIHAVIGGETPGGPTNSEVPVVTGSVTVGDTLTASPGTWSDPQATITYQWQRDSVDIPGATSQSYVAAGEDAGHEFRVKVTATQADGKATSVFSAVAF